VDRDELILQGEAIAIKLPIYNKLGEFGPWGHGAHRSAATRAYAQIITKYHYGTPSRFPHDTVRLVPTHSYELRFSLICQGVVSIHAFSKRALPA
jgi:hypothetical protein